MADGVWQDGSVAGLGHDTRCESRGDLGQIDEGNAGILTSGLSAVSGIRRRNLAVEVRRCLDRA